MHPSLTSIPTSSSVEAWGWVPIPGNLLEVRMFVEFKGSKKIYEYVVPAGEVGAMELAPSKGTYVNNTLKKNFTGKEVPANLVTAAFASTLGPKGRKAKTRKGQPRLTKRERVVFQQFI